MENSKIEWTDSTWNPITGCYHTCPYCYARITANRFKGCDECPDGNIENSTKSLTELFLQTEYGPIFSIYNSKSATTKKGNIIKSAAYPYGFCPTFHRYRLDDLKNKKFGKSIFVCSMADMFREWIPEEWILSIFEVCKRSPEHIYLFLTKNPKRYLQLAKNEKLPCLSNFWYGTTVTNSSEPFFVAEQYNSFISIEPVLDRFSVKPISEEMTKYVDWCIIGAETGKRKEKVIPKKEWITEIYDFFKKQSKPVFMKDSIIPILGDKELIVTELPWNKD